MKRQLVALALIGAAYSSVSAASAADVTPACTDNWSGIYFGGFGGYSFGDNDTVGAVGDADWSGFLGGPLGGFNIELGHTFGGVFEGCDFVIGIEGDVGFGEVDGRDGVVNDIDLEPNGHIRARLGHPLDDIAPFDGMKIMPFVAGGLAIADVDMRIPGLGVDSHTHFGFSIGGGVDLKLTDNIIVRGEYLFDDYESKTYNYPGAAVRVDGFTNTFRGAVMFKFNP
jgi:outer membrane immunogenic protein